jgi:hypothetical protein
MKNKFSLILIFSIISTVFLADYNILKVDKCYGDNKTIVVETCNSPNGFLFNIKANIIQPINFVMVSEIKMLEKLLDVLPSILATPVVAKLF